MYNFITKILILFLFILPANLFAGNQFDRTIAISKEFTPNAFQLVYNNSAAGILIDKSDAEVVGIAANALASDIEIVSGCKPEILSKTDKKIDLLIIAGTIGQSAYIDQLIKTNKLKANTIANKWESFIITTIDQPLKGVKKALVVAGSDRRGTAYGLFEISRLIGISPWIWWADAVPEKHKTLMIVPGTLITHEPSVKYRGIFLNDEDWGLKPWAANNIDTDIKDIGPKTYARIFELLLRLRANFIWPAMHDCTKAFYHYPDNPVIADKYAIVVGSSHCEPMLRNNVFEWTENFEKEYNEKPGEWRYDLNKNQIFRYWNDRVKSSKNYESVYTIGMRGIHDSGLPGPKDKSGKLALMNQVLHDQQSIFEKYFTETSKPAQIFCPYKEVLELYQSGIDLPDYATVVWPDDNHGYIRQLSTPEEQKRKGGSGVYYHLSYWGLPDDYLWLSTISPSLIAYEMTKAYQFGAKNLWVVNVGDIKPAEMETEFFLDMAWDIYKWKPENASMYVEKWTERIFGKSVAADIASVKNEYFRLAQNAKPEHLHMIHFPAEARNERLAAYTRLVEKTDIVKRNIPSALQSAYYQLVEYPVKGAALLNQKIFYAEISLEHAKLKNKAALEYTQKSLQAFDQIKKLTEYYNTGMENGKWNGMMNYSPRYLPVFMDPKVATSEMLTDTTKLIKPLSGRFNFVGEAIEPENIPHFVFASDYKKAHSINGEQIIKVSGLGIGGKSISRYPFTGHSFKQNEFENAPYVEYVVRLESGKYEMSLKCVPTQAIHTRRDLSMAVLVNNQAPQILSVNNPKEDETWRANVVRGFSKADMKIEIYKTGDTVIRIYLLDTGLALSRIDFRATK